jgi:hypothetical protein
MRWAAGSFGAGLQQGNAICHCEDERQLDQYPLDNSGDCSRLEVLPHAGAVGCAAGEYLARSARSARSRSAGTADPGCFSMPAGVELTTPAAPALST